MGFDCCLGIFVSIEQAYIRRREETKNTKAGELGLDGGEGWRQKGRQASVSVMDARGERGKGGMLGGLARFRQT